MKQRKYRVLMVIISLFMVLFIPKVEADGAVITVGTGSIGQGKKYENLQQVFDDAEEGSTIIFEDGSYNYGTEQVSNAAGNGQQTKYKSVTINKSLTIKGSGYNTIILSPFKITGTDKEDKINLESFASGTQEPAHTTIFIDIESPVNLTIKDARIHYMSRNLDSDVKTLYIHNTADYSNVTIDNSSLNAILDGALIESSHTNFTVKNNSQFGGRIALSLKNGTDNTVSFSGNSTLNGLSYIISKDAEEAIQIINQKRLIINVEDSTFQAVKAPKEKETHAISFDGTQTSEDTQINFTGNSTLKTEDPEGKLISFGTGNTADHNNRIALSSGTTVEPSDISTKYDDAEGGNYVVVGIYDYKGDCVIKSYNKSEALPDNEVPKDNIDGYRLKEVKYQTESGQSGAFENNAEIMTENMDIIPKYVKLINVQIGDSEENKFVLEEGQSLDDIVDEPTKGKITKALDELKVNGDKFFDKFVNEEGETIETSTKLYQNTKISAKFLVKVSYHQLEEKIEDGTSLGEKYTIFENQANIDGPDKIFSKFEDEMGEEVTKDTPLSKNTTLTAKYNVEVKFKEKTYTTEEGKSLSIEDQQAINKAAEEATKEFDQFVNEQEEGTKVDITQPFSKNTTLKAKYNVTVSFNNGVKATIPEGSSLSEKYDEIKVEATGLEPNKIFDKFVDENGEEVTKETPLSKNTVLTAKYNVEVKFKGKTYTTEAGKTLNEEDQRAINQAAEETTKEFDCFVDEQEEGTTVDITQPFSKNTTLQAKYNVTVSFNNGVKATIPEGSSLGEKYDEIKAEAERLEPNKTFDKFVEGEQEITKGTSLSKNTVLTAKYNVVITYKEQHYTIPDNTSLSEENQQAINKAAEETTKEFDCFVDEQEGTKVDITQPFSKNTTLKAKYNVTVSFNNGVKATIPEGSSLGEKYDEIKVEAMGLEPNQTFDKFEDENGEEVTKNTPLSKNTTLTAKYNVEVKFKGKTYTTEAGKTLSEEDQQAINQAAEETTKEFDRFVDEQEETKVDITQPFSKNTTLKAQYNVIVTISEETFTLKEGQKLSQSLDAVRIENLLEALKKVDHKTFVKFIDKKGKTIDLDTEIYENTTIIAQYNITVIINDESFVIEENSSLQNLSSEDKKRLTKLKTPQEGYIFKGFRTLDGRTISESDKLDSDIQLETVFEKAFLERPSAKAYENGYDSIRIEVSKISGAEGYDIYRATSHNGTYTKLKDASSFTYIDKSKVTSQYNVNPGWTYYYKIRVWRKINGQKVYADEIIIQGKTNLSKPSVKASSGGYNAVKLVINKVAGAQGYDIYRATSKNGKYTKLKKSSSLTYIDKSKVTSPYNIQTGFAYYYKVIAYRTVSGKKVSSEATILTGKALPGKTKVSLSKYNNSTIKLKWNKVAGASGYEIYRALSTNGKYTKVTTIKKGSTTSYNNKNRARGRRYYYKIKAYRTVNGKKIYGGNANVASYVIK